MSKELFIAAHEELVAEYLDKHPNATDAKAYEATADLAWDRLKDNIADRADYLRMKAKEGAA
jgi:hypothetical protein